ncbi:MAG: tRNA (adenosine(37)-N6)-threonylcarbamoyltransferase complex ATPase subunit type 1 TsaE [Coriobacteriales bacterium]
MKIESDSVEQTIGYGKSIAHLLRPDDMLVLCGDLGAGKTHFTKGVAKGLGVFDEITSPTFNILRTHDGTPGYDDPTGNFNGKEDMPTLAHWDLYRLDEPSQLNDVDFFGIVESGVISLVEWGDKFPDELPDDYVEVDITLDADGKRVLELSALGDRGNELLSQIEQVLVS